MTKKTHPADEACLPISISFLSLPSHCFNFNS